MNRALVSLSLLLVMSVSARAWQDAADIYLDGLEQLAAGAFDEALSSIGRAIDADPENPRYRIGRGAALLFAEQPERAIADLDRAMALSDRSKEARMWRAAADRMCARFFTEVYPQATRDPFESTVGEVSAYWGQTFRAVEPGYEPPPAEQARMRQRLADLRRAFVERASAGGDALQAAWRRGQQRADQGDWQGAAIDVARAFAAWPEDARVVYYQAGCRLALGDPYSARSLYTRALTFDTSFAQAYLGRALAAARMGDAAMARADLSILAARWPELADARRASVDKAIEAGGRNVADAIGAQVRAALAVRRRLDERYQDELRRREDALREHPDQPDALAALATFLYQNVDVPRERVEPRGPQRMLRWQTEAGQQRELARAEELCDRALAGDPDHVRALLTKAALRMWNLHYADAETLLKRALAQAPDDPQVLRLLAQVMEVAAAQKRQFAAALRTPTVVGSSTHIEGDYEVTTTTWRHPSAAEVARAAQLDREAEECLRLAEQHLQRAADAAPGSALGALLRGILARRHGDAEGARAAFAEATRLAPTDAEGWFQLAEAELALGHAPQALAARGEGLNCFETTAAPWLQAAWRAIERTAFVSALALLDEAARRDPADARADAYRAICLAGDGKPADARAAYRRAIAIEDALCGLYGTSFAPDDSRPIATDRLGLEFGVRDRLGRLELAQGDARAAQALFESLVAIEPRLARGQDTEELPRALLPRPASDPLLVESAEPVLALIAWARVRAAEAAVALGDSEHAKALLGRVFEYGQSRVNGYQSDRFRGPELWAHVHLCRAALADNDLQTAMMHAQSLPRRRLGVGPSKGAFPELEEEGSRLQEEVARRQQAAQERGDERSDAWYPADPTRVSAALDGLLRDSGLFDAMRYDERAQNVGARLRVALQAAAQAIVSPKSNRWREDVRFALQHVDAERAALDESAARARAPRDPRFADRGDGPLYANLAQGAARAVDAARKLAIEQGYPADALDRDLGSRSGVPGAALFTGAATDPDARYADLCGKLGLPYLRTTDRIGYTPENMLSVAVRGVLAAVDAPRTSDWQNGVAQSFAPLGQQRTQQETARVAVARQIEQIQRAGGSDPRMKRVLDARLKPLVERKQAEDKSLELLALVVTALRDDAVARGYPAAELDAELVRLGARDR